MKSGAGVAFCADVLWDRHTLLPHEPTGRLHRELLQDMLHMREFSRILYLATRDRNEVCGIADQWDGIRNQMRSKSAVF